MIPVETITAMLFFSWSVRSTSSNKGIDVINSFVISIFKKSVSSMTGGGRVVVVVDVVVVVEVVVGGGIIFNNFWFMYSISTIFLHSSAGQSGPVTFSNSVINTRIVTLT